MAGKGISRRSFVKSVSAGTAAALARGAMGAAEKRPNVVLYVVDDQGTDDAGCYGNPVIHTPGLDALAAEGTRFRNGFCTTPSCSASRSVILTGWHNHATGQYGHAHAYNHFVSHPYVKSLPYFLSQAGYRTARVGKYHVAPEEVYYFDETLPTHTPEQMAASCEALFRADDEKPFFLYFCTTEPHRPFVREGSRPISPDEVIVPDYLPDSSECRDELAKYYMSVERADKGLLRLMEELKAAGQWDNTLVIYISDNGIAFPGAKTNLYEPGMRLPCVIRSPFQRKKGHACDALMDWTSITPTILDFCGALPEGHAFHGPSVLDALDEESPAGYDEVYASHTFHEITMYYPMRVVRERRYKLIWNIAHGLSYPFASDLWESTTWQGIIERNETLYAKRPVSAYLKRPAFELYDLENDPDELVNLADDPAHADRLAAMQAKLKAFQKRTQDPWILKWEHE